MKKVALFLVLAMLLSMMFGCGADGAISSSDDFTDEQEASSQPATETPGVIDNRSVSKTSEASNTETPKEVITVSDSDFETHGYLYESMFGDSMYFLSVKNNSKATVEIDVNGVAKDSSGNMIGAGSSSIDVLGPNEETICYVYFSGVAGISSVDYTLSYNTSPYYMPVISNLEMTQTLNNENVTISVTNNGDICAEFVEAYALFFDADDNVIKYASDYLVDNDSEIKPGKTMHSQLDSYEAYDHVLVFLTGRSDGKSVDMSQYISEENFEIEEYQYESSFGDTMFFMAITNNSSETVCITGNGLAKDANGVTLGAADMSIEVLGPGEQTLGYFYFDSVSAPNSVEYELSYSTDVNYDAVISNLEVQQTINDGNVIVAVTNKGTYEAEFVEAHALFLDASGNVISHGSTYIVDNDSEIKPGATIVEQIDTYEAFDTVKIFFTGRHSNW